MIDWPEDTIAISLARSFANVAAAAMAQSTGMKFTVNDVEGGVEIATDDPTAVAREFGTDTDQPESWSIKGLFAAERMFNEPAQGGV